MPVHKVLILTIVNFCKPSMGEYFWVFLPHHSWPRRRRMAWNSEAWTWNFPCCFMPHVLCQERDFPWPHLMPGGWPCRSDVSQAASWVSSGTYSRSHHFYCQGNNSFPMFGIHQNFITKMISHSFLPISKCLSSFSKYS